MVLACWHSATGVTVYAPLRKHITRPDMRVAVLGVGGLGHLALQFASNMGAAVSARTCSPLAAHRPACRVPRL